MHSLCWASGALLGGALPDSGVPRVLGSGLCFLHFLFSLHLCPVLASFHVRLSVCRSSPLAPALHTSPLFSSLPPYPLVTLLSITITQNRRIFYYLVSLLNQVLCPLFFIFKVDECHTIFSH